ncbi:efflux RND transporter periplasmic adaptor subunit [Prosthecobacter sp.]|jgi:multidrug efflux pump subunit AcrA (membrane-fusion protein)|uniref:efflux RND transporter periplasmic adaptor subunit n=1 Tax=Prosthecobacter sp. TaxID=1965333 RepID=UPI0037845A70
MKLPVLPLIALFSLGWAVTSVISKLPQETVTAPPAPPPRSVYADTVAAVGLIEPSSELITLGSHRSGVVEQTHVKAGQQVKKGDTLVTLDTRQLRAELAVAKAHVNEAQAALAVSQAEEAQARRNVEFARSLTDARAMSDEERTQRELTLGTAQAKVKSNEATILRARTQIEVIETELARSVITAPRDATVLQVKVREGEYIAATPTETPWLVLGDMSVLHVRADVDEYEAWKVRPTSQATAQVRGNPSLAAQLEFVRFEPLVIPKKSLTGDATERVDTRVLQVIYRLQKPVPAALFAGQQMDVFIATQDAQP